MHKNFIVRALHGTLLSFKNLCGCNYHDNEFYYVFKIHEGGNRGCINFGCLNNSYRLYSSVLNNVGTKNSR